MTTWDPRANDLFLQAQGLSAGDRPAFLDRACAGDAALRAEVEALLEAGDRAGSFLERPAAALDATVTQPPAADHAGTVIGPYKLLQQIGEGGMGTVFLAEQTHPVQRRVALKVIKAGMDTAQVVARFEAERQALALMDHPNIARVFDAGTTQGEPGGVSPGRPYFVMELVKGVPITKYCDEHRLTPRQRLELFVPVCQAVQHAHQKGIIHRDLKPSNVLVAPYDGRPVPKVIDFGVAKATGQRLTEKTLFTDFGAVVGTLEYMSPEQAELNNQDIDTRSDIYSLGVLLYELLTGTTPLTRARLKAAAFTEMLRLIREEEPQKPSTRLSESKDALPSISAQRQTEPAKLTREVRGELDWIVMKSLEKDRTRRYETANGFAQDVLRYLADEPVLACPPSARYRLKKLIRRHKGPVLAAALVMLALLTGLIGLGWGLVQADRSRRFAEGREQEAATAYRAEAAQRARAEQNADTAERVVDDLYTDFAQEWLARQPRLTEAQRTYLLKALGFYQRLADEFGGDPAAAAKAALAYKRVGQIEYKLGQLESADRAFGTAAETLERLAAGDPRSEYRADWAGCLQDRALVFRQQLRLAEAETTGRQAVALFETPAAPPAGPETRVKLADALSNLALTLSATRRPAEAERLYHRAIGLVDEGTVRPGQSAVPALAAYWNNLGGVLLQPGRLPDAERAFGRAVTLLEKTADDLSAADRHLLVAARGNLAIVHAQTGRPDAAATALGAAVRDQAKLVADFPSIPEYQAELADLHANLSKLHLDTRRPADAAREARTAIAGFEKLVRQFPRLPEYSDKLADLHTRMTEMGPVVSPADVADHHRRAIALHTALADAFPADVHYRWKLAKNHTLLGQRVFANRAEATAHFRKALGYCSEYVKAFPDRPDGQTALAGIHRDLATALREAGEYTEATAHFRAARAIQTRLAAAAPDDPAYQRELGATLNNEGMMFLQRDQPAEARALLEQAVRHQEAALKAEPTNPKSRQFLRNHYDNLTVALGMLGIHAEAAKAAEQLPRLNPASATDFIRAAGFLAKCMTLAGADTGLTDDRRRAAAQQYGNRAVELLKQAVAKGFVDADGLRKNPSLEPLRPRPDFQKLLIDSGTKPDS